LVLTFLAERGAYVSDKRRDLVFGQRALERRHIVLAVRNLVGNLSVGHFLDGIRIQIGRLQGLAGRSSRSVGAVTNHAIRLERLRANVIGRGIIGRGLRRKTEKGQGNYNREGRGQSAVPERKPPNRT